MRSASVWLLAAASLQGAVMFEPNRGQSAAGVDFVARVPNGVLGLNAGRMELERRDGTRASIRLLGASNRSRSVAEARAPGVSHYAIGSDASRWIWDVPRYSQVRFAGVYPGIDIAWHGRSGDVEFDFLVAPGADPSRIALQFSEPVRLTSSGELVSGPALLRRPAAWQTVNGARAPVHIEFSVRGKSRARLKLGPYDRSRPLTIDPTIVMASFLGGSENEGDSRIAVGTDGAIYLAGATASADFPASLPPGALLNRPVALLAPDVYVTRIKPDGAAQDWSLFLGGNGAESVMGLRRDSLGNLFILGGTGSPDFPVTSGAYQSSIHRFLTDLFLVKLDAQTGRIKASTFLGVPSSSALLAVDFSGGVYVAGTHNDNAFKTTPGAYQPNTIPPHSNDLHGFVLRLNSPATALVYATLLDFAKISAMEVDDSGNAVLGGTVNAFAPSGAPRFQAVNPIPGVNQEVSGQAFICKLNPTGTAMVFATQLHGDAGYSSVSDLKVASEGTIHVLGYASPHNFPLVSPLDLDPPASSSSNDEAPYWAKLPPGGGHLVQSTVLYGPQFITAPSLAYSQTLRLALPPGGQPCFLNAGSASLQQTPGALVGKVQDHDTYSYGGTLVCVNSDGTGLNTKTMLPAGAAYSEVAAAPDGTLLFTGTARENYRTTPGALQPRFGGGVMHDQFYPYALDYADAFVARLSFDNPLPRVRSLIPETMLLVPYFHGTFSVDVYGSGFAHGMEAVFNGQPVTSRFVDEGRIILSNIDYAAVQPGANQIGLSLAGPGGGTFQAVFTGINPTPAAPSLSPAMVAQGAGETKVVIRAVNLAQNTTLYWNGKPRAAQFVADGPSFRSGHFELMMGADELATPSAAEVALSNPAPGGGMSPSALFAVQPASGDGVPVLNAITAPVVFGGSAAPGPKLSLAGSGFTSSTRAYWDGSEVPAELVSPSRIDITPPAADLARWGAHSIHVVNGVYRSAAVRQLVARAINGAGYAAADPVNQRLYVTVAPSGDPQKADLAIFDLRTGDQLGTVPDIVQSPLDLKVSSDGHYVYLASASRTGRITRYDALLGAVDLQWEFEATTSSAGSVASLLPVPNSPEALIVWSNTHGVTIFDRDRPRWTAARAMGFSAGDTPAFATASRIYLHPANGTCWRWMEYDGFGISGGTPSCAGDAGPDVVRDGGFTYLTDGSRAYVVAKPALTYTGSHTQAAFLPDLPRRRILQATAAGQITEFNLDTEQQIAKATIPASSYSPPMMLNGADGAAILVTSSWLGMLP
ncbi:MAG: hypothetical protein IT158_19030 [Bryobacterales bacterium]|nr:hypothetical protein [Bryobacterales bacterium]